MKKIFFTLLMMLVCVMTASAQAKIKFEKTVHNFGQFSEADAKQSCAFTFTNAGDKPLVINQAVASCGCTVPTYTKTPVLPGEKGELKIMYNGAGRFPGHFKKTITVRTNGTPEVVRLYIEGDMTETKK
ncbi:MAG: DUF1573 domain-containing protein [Prevotella sp.]|nr:DUF1573 domain-containing protein [Prevotella sp.]